MLDAIAKTLVNESAKEIGIQVKDIDVIDEQKFVEWAKSKLDAILPAPTQIEETAPITEYHYGTLKISETYCRPFSFDRMESNYRFKGHQAKESSFTLFDIKLLMMLESELNFKSWNNLSQLTGLNLQVMERLLYNLQIGFFDEWINCSPTFTKEYGLLYIDGKKTDVPIRTVKYIVNCLAGSSTPIKTLLKLEKGKECPQWIYRIIGTNYKNKELVSLFEKPAVEIENNPQKRKENGL